MTKNNTTTTETIKVKAVVNVVTSESCETPAPTIAPPTTVRRNNICDVIRRNKLGLDTVTVIANGIFIFDTLDKIDTFEDQLESISIQ
jgi:hypothetical protein